MSAYLKEYRCFVNNKLLCKASGVGQVEIMNPTNRVLNYTGPSRRSQDIGLKGVEFQSNSVDLHCSNCGRLQARAIGLDLKVEIKCRYCKETTFFDVAEINSKRIRPLHGTAKKAWETRVIKMLGL